MMGELVLSAEDLDMVVQGLVDVCEEFGAACAGPPTLAELLEILGWAVPDDGDYVDGSFASPLPLSATLRGGQRYRSEQPSRVGELNDHVFVDAQDLNIAVLQRICEITGAPATPQQFAGVMLAALRSGRVRPADTCGSDIGALTAPRARYARKTTPGDLFAIPVGPGAYRIAVVLIRNQFGTAVGLFEGRSADGQASTGILGSPRPHPVYTDESLIKNGTWIFAGHNTDVLAAFPADPEIYHAPHVWEEIDIDTGEFGAAETADGRMRMIDSSEARDIGLTDNSYRQCVTAEHLQDLLSAE
ncbi:hypothetical protein [Nocardia sp. NPDC127526]|uniref:hypothetical protein n=1 Tax=Nocardia sp. NPDC127526 TaxID=3345393 RepID=UPI00363B39E5